METFVTLETSKLYIKYGEESLVYLELLTQKRGGRIKGGACVDREKQWAYIKKEYSESTTVSFKDIMITYDIQTHEGIDVATIDIPG